MIEAWQVAPVRVRRDERYPRPQRHLPFSKKCGRDTGALIRELNLAAS